MEVAYEYSKRRSEFGKPCRFSDETQLLESILPTDVYDEKYVLRNPTVTGVDTTPHLSETEVNTAVEKSVSSSMRHVEGGWPKDVDFTEQGDVKRFRKKVEKDDDYQYAMKTLVPRVRRCMHQNNTVDIYEEYFRRDAEREHGSSPPFAKGLAVFRDPSAVTRTATSVDWHPEGGKLAVSYAVLHFQDERLSNPDMPASSYIWDITNSNKPIIELVPPSPLCCLRYNPKSSDTLVGGCHNGTIAYYDLRKQPNGPSGKCQPAECSVVEKSHHDPVSDVFWVSSKTGHHVVSTSTDGQMLWWDTRSLEEPIDSLVLAMDAKGGGGMALGGSSLEYNTEAGPTKFLVGTEQGIVMSLNTRNKKTNNGITVFDAGSGKHNGPIPSIHRNPTHTKYFLTVGDWTARVWTEDLKTPIITTKYHTSYLTGGCWSPTRAGVFYVTRSDGIVDVWDMSHNQNKAAYSHKVSDAALSSIGVEGSAQQGGKLVAVGDVHGTVSLLEVCDALATPQPNEKAVVNAMLERETKREKNLGVRELETRRAKAQEEERKRRAQHEEGAQEEERKDEAMRELEREFFDSVGLDENGHDEDGECQS